jgi:hypothetical protein
LAPAASSRSQPAVPLHWRLLPNLQEVVLNRISKLLALTAVAAALVAAGCGDDEEDPTTPATTATDASTEGSATLDSWVKRADEICTSGDQAAQQAAQQAFGNKQPSEEELTAFASDVVVPNLQEQYDAISALPKPEAEAEQIDAMLSSLQTGINQVNEDPGALVQGTDSIPAIQEATEQAKELGLTDCGSG